MMNLVLFFKPGVTSKGKNSHKEKSAMHLMFQYHPPKTPVGKMDAMT